MSKAEIFKTLSQVDVSKLVKKKMGLNYLSWADAWAILMKYYPESTYSFKEFPEYCFSSETKEWKATGRNVDYRKTECGTEVVAKLNIKGEVYEMSLYVMDNRNRVIKQPDYAQINKTQQRCLVKAIALAGLGLTVYQGEDLPSSENTQTAQLRIKNTKTISKLDQLKQNYTALMAKVCDAKKLKAADLQAELIKGLTGTNEERYEAMITKLEMMLQGQQEEQQLNI